MPRGVVLFGGRPFLGMSCLSLCLVMFGEWQNAVVVVASNDDAATLDDCCI